MQRNQLDSICELLSSNKIRNRNEALDKLQKINFALSHNVDLFDNDRLLNVISSLDLYLQSDKAIYERSNSNAVVESRLNKASNILRLIITHIYCSKKFITLYKPRQSEKIVSMLLRHLVYIPGKLDVPQLFEPVIINIVKALNQLFTTQCFIDHLFSSTLKHVLEDTLKSIKMSVSSTTQKARNENVIIELLTLLKELLSPSHTEGYYLFSESTEASDSYYRNIVQLIFDYYKYTFCDNKRERESLILIFNIMNKCISDLSTINIKLCHRLYKLGTQMILDIKTITSERLVLELAVFLIVSSNFVALNHITKLEGCNWEIDSLGELKNESTTTSIIYSKSEMSDVYSAVINPSSELDESQIFSDDDLHSQSNQEITTKKRVREGTKDGTNPHLHDLSKLIEVLLGLLQENNLQKLLDLPLGAMNLHLFALEREKCNVFHMKYASLAEGEPSTPLLLRLGITKMLVSYYELKEQTSSSSSNGGISTPTKRRHIMNYQSSSVVSVSDMLPYFDNPIEFLLGFLSDVPSTQSYQIFEISKILAILFSYISNANETVVSQKLISFLVSNKDRYLMRLVSAFEKYELSLKYWILFSISIFHSIVTDYHSEKTSTTIFQMYKSISFSKLLKYCLELLKDPFMTKISCIFLTQFSIKQYSEGEMLELDRSVVQQYENILDLSEINGPALLCKESMMFWISSQLICKQFKLKGVKFHQSPSTPYSHLFSTKILSWFFGKFEQSIQIKDNIDIICVCIFILWLSGKNVTEFNIRRIYYDNLYSGEALKFALDLERKNYLLNNILQLQNLEKNGKMERKSLNLKFENLSVSDESVAFMKPKFSTFVDKLTANQSHFKWGLCFLVILPSDFLGLHDSLSMLLLFMKDKFKSYSSYDKFESYLSDYFILTQDLHNCHDGWSQKVEKILSVEQAKEVCLFLLNRKEDPGVKVSEFDFFEPELVDRNDGLQTQFPNYNIYHERNLYLRSITLEQQFIIYLFQHIDHREDKDFAIRAAVEFSASLKSHFKLMASSFEILKELEKNSECVLSESTIDAFFGQLTSLLEDHFTKTLESCVVLISTVFRFFCSSWIRSKSGIESDGRAVFEFFMNLHQKDMLTSQKARIEVFKFCCTILSSNSPDEPFFNSDEIIEYLKTEFCLMGNVMKFRVFENISNIISQSKNMHGVYHLFKEGFKTPQESLEKSATFCLFLAFLSQSDQVMIIKSAVEMLHLSKFEQMRPYIKTSMLDISMRNNIQSTHKLFWNYKDLFCRSWLVAGISFDRFPYYLFGFDCIEDFIMKTYKVIVALELAWGNVEYFDKVAKVTGMKEVSLITDSISLAIPFVCCEGKRQSDLFKLFVLFLGPMAQVNAHLKEQFSLICFQIIRYADVSNEEKLTFLGEKYEDLQFFSDTPVLCFEDENKMFIAPKTCFEIINYFGSKLKIENVWSIPMIYYLASRFLLLIETSELNIERILHLRRLKMIIATDISSLENPNVAELIIKNVSRYLQEDDLRKDIIAIILIIIERNKGKHDRLSVSTWLSIIGCLLNKKSCLPDKFIQQVVELESKINLGAFTSALKMGIRIIESNDQLGEINLVQFVNSAFCLPGETYDLVHYLSLLFESSSSFSSTCLNSTVAENMNLSFIQNLFEIKLQYSSHLSKRMMLWMGQCIGKFYSETGLSPENRTVEFDNALLSNGSVDFAKETKSIDMIFKLMIKNSLQSTLHTRYCLNVIAGVILDKQNNSSENLSSFMSYDTTLQSFESYILPFGHYVCSLSMDELEAEKVFFSKLGLESTLNGFEINVKVFNYKKWMSDILFAIITELSVYSSIFILLANYTSHVPEFAVKCFCPMVLYYIENEPLKKGKLIARMIEQFFGMDFRTLDKEAITLYVELVLLIRIGTKQGNEKFINVERYFDIQKVCDAALYIGKAKTALMLLEDDISQKNAKEFDKDNAFVCSKLKEIYNGIEDTDLMFGLPVVPDLNHGVDILKNSGIRFGEMMFNNALFESQLRSDHTTTSEKLFEINCGMMNLGWNGISNVIYEYSSEGGFYDNQKNKNKLDLMYEQMWKLDRWDIPVSDDILTENSCVYSTLKMFKDGADDSSATYESFIQRLMSINIDEFKREGFSGKDAVNSWAKTLSICNGVSELSFLRDHDFPLYNKNYQRSIKWYTDANVLDFENIIMSRLAILQIMSSSKDQKIGESFQLDKRFCDNSIVNELHHYSFLVAERGMSQKAINAAVMLNKISTDIFGQKNSAVETIAKFDMAKAFWTQQYDTRFPVETLKAILQQEDFRNTIDTNPDQQITFSDFNYGITAVSKELVLATLAKWCDYCKQETSSAILDKYILPLEQGMKHNDNLSHINEIGLTFHIMARFCDDQITRISKNESTEKLVEKIHALETDIKALSKYLKQEEDREKRRAAAGELTRLKLRHTQEMGELNDIKNDTETYKSKAIDFYCKSIGFGEHDFIDSDIDRFCSLWIEHTEIKVKKENLLCLPTFNFVTWITQLVSKLLDENTAFQKLLKELVINISIDHPFHVLYLLKSLLITRQESDDIAATSRGKAAEKVWKILKLQEEKFKVEGISNIMEGVDSFAERSVEISNVKLKNSRKISMLKMPNGKWWTETLPLLSLPSPLKEIKVLKNGSYKSSDLHLIVKIDETVAVAASGISHPKIMKILLSTGETQKILLKAPDDLRQDSIMQQVFEKVNKLLWKNIDTRKRNLRIRTYKVLPLGPTSGVLEFVPNSMALMDILKSLHQGDKMSINEARAKMKEIQDQSKIARIKAYKEICKKVSPSLKTFFFNNFTSPDIWFESRSLYCHGTATTSITGYILGIGDRHCNNILLDKASGEPIHIDFGVAFDQGKSLPVPETVPFRLTRDIVDAMGITGVSGMYSKSCEFVFKVLRENRQYICGILNVLKYDPLYSWTLSPLRKKKLQQIYFADESSNSRDLEVISKNVESEATSAIDMVNKKLEAKGLSDEAVVRELIRDAVSPDNLALIFMGWSPFL